VTTEDRDSLKLWTIAQLAEAASQDRRTIFRRIADGTIRIVKLGGSTRIPDAEARRYLAGEQAKVVAPTTSKLRRTS